MPGLRFAGPGTRRLAFGTALTLIGALGVAVSVAPPAGATRVCIEYLDGYRCETFREPTPKAPGNTRGMTMSITPQVLTGTNELQITAGRFTKGEVVRAWVYNIFGQGRMSALTNVYEANKKGRVSITYAPSTTLYEASWGQPYMCMRGERSLKLACAPFSIADSSAPNPQPTPTSPGTPGSPSAPTSPSTPASPSPSSSGSLAPGCIDAGFTIICTN